MDKETLSNYGWIVICVLVLAVMIALATPFGTFVSDAVQSTTKGLFDVNKEALGAAGIEIMEQEFENELNGDNGEEQTPTQPETPAEPGSGDIVAPEKAKFVFYLYNSDMDWNIKERAVEYTAEEGMTWAEWVNSEYNINGCTVSGATITAPTHTWKESPMMGTAILPTDTIIPNAYYSFFEVVFSPTEDNDLQPVIVSFTIDGKTYQAEENMTWTNWIFSVYNTDKFSFKGDGVSANGYLHNADETQKIYLCCTDSIITNHNYQSSK